MGNESTTTIFWFQRCDINESITEKSNGKYSLEKPKDKVWILEVDLEYPKELHKLHNDYPLAPDKNSSGK